VSSLIKIPQPQQCGNTLNIGDGIPFDEEDRVDACAGDGAVPNDLKDALLLPF